MCSLVPHSLTQEPAHTGSWQRTTLPRKEGGRVGRRERGREGGGREGHAWKAGKEDRKAKKRGRASDKVN